MNSRSKLLKSGSLLLVLLFANTASIRGALSDVRSVKITNTRTDWFYIEEIEILNSSGQDVASVAFNSTANGNSVASFGSSINGPIDDEIGECCATGYHSSDPLGPNRHSYIITFPTPQDLDGDITVWNRLDGSFPERMDGMLFEYFDGTKGTGNLIDSQQVDNIASDNPGAISSAEGASFPIAGPPPPLVFTSINLDPATREVEFVWRSRSGFSYVIDSSTDLVSWMELEDDIASDSTSTSHSETLPDPAPGRIYYRVREFGQIQ